MKQIIIALLAALTCGARAQTTIELGVSSCTATRICYDPVNDGLNPDGTPLVIDYISASASYGRVTMSINGVLWDSGLYAVYPMPEDFTDVTLHDGAGRSVLLTANYTHWTTLNRSGHNYYVQHWRLDSGSLAFSDCVGDFDGDGVVDGSDMGIMLISFGDASTGDPTDLNGDGVVDSGDIGELLLDWGPCP